MALQPHPRSVRTLDLSKTVLDLDHRLRNLGDNGVAIDLRANGGGPPSASAWTASGQPAPQIRGNILFGSGGDTLDILAGTVNGKIDFGGGADVMTLGGSGLFRGTLAGSAGLAVTIGTGSTLDVQNLGTVDLASLTGAAGSNLGVTIGATSHTLYNVAGTADFGTGSKILVTLNTVGSAAGIYTIIDAGTLVGGDNLSSVSRSVPCSPSTALFDDDRRMVLYQAEAAVVARSLLELRIPSGDRPADLDTARLFSLRADTRASHRFAAVRSCRRSSRR